MLIILAVKYSIINDEWKGGQPIPISLPEGDNIPYTVSTFDFGIAKTCIYLIDAVYSDDGVNIDPQKIQIQKQFISRSHNRSVYGTAYLYNGIYWIAFRGTTDIYDAIRDTMTNQLKPTWSLNKNVLRADDSDIMIHEGFHAFYSELRDQIVDWLATVDADSKIVLTGHSLGGGLALLVASDDMFSKFSLTDNVVLYTIGCPRVGNPQFIEYLRRLKLSCFRITNTDDIVATTPLSITIRPFHPSRPFMYEHFGNPVMFNMNRYSFARNHSLYWYFDALTHFQSYRLNYNVMNNNHSTKWMLI